MTFFHFLNCVALACVPHLITYKYAGISEYNAFWKYLQTGFLYLFIQFLKMMVLATFFPALDDSTFDPVVEFFKTTIDIADLIGLYFAITKISGKCEIKYLIAGSGWAFAELIMTRILPLWVGARGVEFDWTYIQQSLDSNINLLQNIVTALLIYIYNRNDKIYQSKLIYFLITMCCYKPLLVGILIHGMKLGSWSLLVSKFLFTMVIGYVSLHLYNLKRLSIKSM